MLSDFLILLRLNLSLSLIFLASFRSDGGVLDISSVRTSLHNTCHVLNALLYISRVITIASQLSTLS